METSEDVFKTICRVCLCRDNSENMVSLIDKNSKDDLSCFGRAAQIFANICITADFLPSFMCRKCLQLLKQAILFKKTCENSQEKIDTFLSSTQYSEAEFRVKFIDYVVSKNSTSSFDALQVSKTGIKAENLQKTKDSKDFITSIKTKGKQKLKTEKSENKESLSEKSQNIGFANTSFLDSDDSNLDFDSNDCTNLIHFENYSADGIINTLEEFVNKNLEKESNNKKKDFSLLPGDQSSSAQKIDENKNLHGDKIYGHADQLLYSMEQLIGETNESLPNSSNTTVKKEKKYFEIEIKIEPERCDKKKTSNSGTDRKVTGKNLATKKVNNRTHRSEKEKKRRKNEKAKEEHICEYCNKNYSTKASLVSHMNRHTGTYNFICESCAIPYPTKSELQFHLVAAHNIGTRHICDYCGYRTHHKFSLVEHVRKHTGEKPFQCEQCGIKFRHKHVWKAHKVYHIGKTIECDECNMKFYKKSGLLQHKNNVHDRRYMYACNFCDVTYTKTGTMRRHMEEKHGIEKAKQGKIERISLDKSGHSRPRERKLLRPDVAVNLPF